MNAAIPPILIVEDEPFIALDLKLAFEDHGSLAEIASDCAEAMEIIGRGRIRGAVLDVNLGRGQTCWPIAERLDELKIPYLLHTGDLNREGERLRTTDVPVIAKPALAENVVARLLGLIPAAED